MTKPDGSDGDYNGSSSTGSPAYNHGGLISPTSSLMYGTWNLKICAPEYDMCVEKDFTINAPSDASSNVDFAFLFCIHDIVHITHGQYVLHLQIDPGAAVGIDIPIKQSVILENDMHKQYCRS